MTPKAGPHKGPGREAHAAVLIDRLVHDLKQPLNLIRVTAQQVQLDIKRERLDRATLPADMAEIIGAVDELVVRIDALRTVLTPDAEAKPTTASLEVACQAAMDRAQADHSGAGVELALAGPLPAVIAAPDRLAHALWELLDNAIRAVHSSGRDGGVRVSARHEGGEVAVTIDDDGNGVSAAEQERIFEPFFTTRRNAAGLGLPLAAALVRAAGGRLVLAHSSEQGTRFQVVLTAVASGSALEMSE